jgi:hypothetical protein
LNKHFEVENFFDSKGRLRYSWENKHRDGIKVWARLDRLYAFKSMGAWRDGSIVSYEIKRDCGCPIIAWFSFATRWGNQTMLEEAFFV